MDAVKAYKKRRRKRMLARFDDEEIEWITTKTGSHVPLLDGEAVGGPMEGKQFKSAESNSGKGVTGVKRKQKDIDEAFLDYDGSVKDEKIEEFNRKAVASIMEETGLAKSEAEEVHACMMDYFGKDYHDYATGEKNREVRIINHALKKMEAYDGLVYRGMSIPSWEEKEVSKFKRIKVGDEIKMRTISSWSSDPEVGETFSDLSGSRQTSIFIVCNKNRTGVGVQHLSRLAKSEAEVLAPSDARWRVTKKTVVDKYQFLLNNSGIGKERSEDDKEFVKRAYESKRRWLEGNSVIMLEVEEI